MPLVTKLVNGTGLAGSLMYSSNASRGWSLEGEAAASVEVERAGLRLWSGPGGEAAPFVASGIKENRGRQLGVGLALEVMFEEGELDFVAEPRAGLHVEADLAEGTAVAARPSAMYPRAHDERLRALRLVGGGCAPEA